MKLRIASDLHTEFFDYSEIPQMSEIMLPRMEDEHEQTLILAGDIGAAGSMMNLTSFLGNTVPRFKKVLYIPGNHEYYGGDLTTTADEITKITDHLNQKLFFAEFGCSVIDNNKIVMTTLWTDFDKGSEDTMLEAWACMNDYRQIRHAGKMNSPSRTYERHNEYVQMIRGVPVIDVMVTHHLPSQRSIPQEFKDAGRINGAYASDLEWLIEEKKPKLWLHGHTHTACDYMIGTTRIIANPRGYGNQYKKNGYNPELVVEI